ncbi:hypothetical protein LDENG_00277280 [Lucifuga dentata]|nr:hypothetical protein LDENG_00277280 [Lucifuga dentata]
MSLRFHNANYWPDLLKDHTGHFACLSLIYNQFLYMLCSKACYWNSELNIFCPTFQTAIGFCSFWYAIKINLILETFLE